MIASYVAQTCSPFMSHHPPATHMPAVGLCQPSVAVADRAPLLQIVPEPPNRTAAHTVSQPHRDKKHIMCVGCDKTWMSEAAIAAGHRVGSRGNPRAAPHFGRVAARLYPTPVALAKATTRRESREIHALSHVR